MNSQRAVLALFALVLGGCSSVGASAIRTGPLALPAYSGPVAVHASGRVPAGAVDLGMVEVHAAQQEGTVDTLLPMFVRKVADIGGNIAVIDGIRARFEIVGRSHVETFYYSCTTGAACAGTRVYSTDDELMIVSMIGHAMTTAPRPETTPLAPVEPLPAEPAATPPDGSEPPAPAPAAPDTEPLLPGGAR